MSNPVCSLLQDGWPSLPKAICLHEHLLCLTQAPKLATVEEARDWDSGTLGSVPRLAAAYSHKSTGFGVRNCWLQILVLLYPGHKEQYPSGKDGPAS